MSKLLAFAELRAVNDCHGDRRRKIAAGEAQHRLRRKKARIPQRSRWKEDFAVLAGELPSSEEDEELSQAVEAQMRRPTGKV